MDAAHIQIVSYYEEAELSPELIAEEMRVSVDYVRKVLMQFSTKYKGEIRTTKAENREERAGVYKHPYIEEGELREMYEAYKVIAFTAQDENVKEKALRTLIDDARGRKDVEQRKLEEEQKQAAQQKNLNLQLLAGLIEKARAQKQQLLEPELTVVASGE